MTENQPYLMRAIHEWILDNEFTPNILVNADLPNVQVPMQSVKDGQIVLNIAPQAVNNLFMDNEAVSFSARFSGVVENIYIPTYAVKAIYASENGQGLVFPEMEINEEILDQKKDVSSSKPDVQEIKSASESQTKAKSKPKPKSKPKKEAPFLKVIK